MLRSIPLVLAVLVAGCPPAGKKAPPPAKQDGCTQFGQSCEVSPGKLGTCVTKEGCTDAPPACFVCQSQH